MAKKEYIKLVNGSPDKVLAGDSVTIKLKMEAGKDFKAKNSRIMIDFPAYLGASRPNLIDQENDGYVAVFCSNPDVKYIKRNWDIEVGDFPTMTKMGFRGMAQRFFLIDNITGDVQEGDVFEVHFGYTRDNFGVGAKMPVIVLQKEFYNEIDIRYFEDANVGLPDYCRDFEGYKRPVPDYEYKFKFRIFPRETESIRIISNQSKTLAMALDRFGNPSENPQQYIEEPGTANEYDVLEYPPNTSLKVKEYPVNHVPNLSKVLNGMNIYFGDLHCHSTVSNDCIEREKMTMTPDMMFDYGKNVSGLDFMAITDHHQPWDVNRNVMIEEGWAQICTGAERYNSNGEFIALPGFEFRCVRGDAAVVLKQPWEYDFINDPKITSIQKLWDKFKGRDYITIPHMHLGGNLCLGDWFFCPYEGVETVLEVYSCHGSYEADKVIERMTPMIKHRRRDRNAAALLEMGNMYGFCCNSDGHKGNPGRNGLTAVFADELTRDSIFDAIRNRRVYGTTNARIKLISYVNGTFAGQTVEDTKTKTIRIAAEGEKAIKSVDVIADGALLKRFKPDSIVFDETFNTDVSFRYCYVKVTQHDNHIAYGSPVWQQNPKK